jgi:enoyl-CoA hydratase/carnithine racemase
MTAHRFVDYRVDADGVAVLRWNRPDARNALLPEMTDEAMAALDEAASDDAVRTLVLSGAGDAFSAGADLKLMGRGDRLGRTALEGWRRGRHGIAGPRKLLDFPKPTLAAVHGSVAGMACAWALACDVVIAGADARFHLSFVRVGFVTDCGRAGCCSVGSEWGKRSGSCSHGDSVDAAERRASAFATSRWSRGETSIARSSWLTGSPRSRLSPCVKRGESSSTPPGRASRTRRTSSPGYRELSARRRTTRGGSQRSRRSVRRGFAAMRESTTHDAAAPGRGGRRALAEQPALVGGRERWSYLDLAAETARVAAGLEALGVRPGEPVGVLLPNWPQFFSAVYGVQAAGGVAVCLSTWRLRTSFVMRSSTRACGG